MAIFVTIYNYRAHNYFITIVMKFRNYFPSSSNDSFPGFSPIAQILVHYSEYSQCGAQVATTVIDILLRNLFATRCAL